MSIPGLLIVTRVVALYDIFVLLMDANFFNEDLIQILDLQRQQGENPYLEIQLTYEDLGDATFRITGNSNALHAFMRALVEGDENTLSDVFNTEEVYEYIGLECVAEDKILIAILNTMEVLNFGVRYDPNTVPLDIFFNGGTKTTTQGRCKQKDIPKGDVEIHNQAIMSNILSTGPNIIRQLLAFERKQDDTSPEIKLWVYLYCEEKATAVRILTKPFAS